MKVFTALLRGINVGGKNILPMKELTALLENLGAQNVKTYIQSGNAVFQHENENSLQLSEKIAVGIKEEFGFKPHVVLLGLDELEQAVDANPFPYGEADPKTLHLYFTASAPNDPDLEILENLKSESEMFSLTGKVFYLHAPGGIGRSKLAAKVEKVLGVPVTARNWRTVSKILERIKEF